MTADYVSIVVVTFVGVVSFVILFLMCWTVKVLLSLEIIIEPSAGAYPHVSPSQSISNNSAADANNIQGSERVSLIPDGIDDREAPAD